MSNFEYKEIRDKITRFRILIIGRRNAGKTSILQRVCNTTEQPEIYDAEGNKISQDSIAPTIGRGLHDIENELVFKSNLGFVFHDSRGFEAGRDDELKFVQDFIARRSREKEMNDRIHAIWYCIPVDNSRPITAAEKFFFSECGTGIVPVVVVFTKMHAQDAQEYHKAGSPTDLSHLRESSVTFVEDNYLKELKKLKYGPKSSVCLGEIKVEDMNCGILIEKTLSVLNNFTLKMLLVTTQQISKEINVKFVIKESIVELLQKKAKTLDLSHQIDIVRGGWIEFEERYYRLLRRSYSYLRRRDEIKDCLSFSKFQELLDQSVSIQVTKQPSILVKIACKGLALLVVSLYASALFSPNLHSSSHPCLITALIFYNQQIQCANINQGVQSLYLEFKKTVHWYTTPADRHNAWEILGQQLIDLVLQNQLSINDIERHAEEAIAINLYDWKN